MNTEPLSSPTATPDKAITLGQIPDSGEGSTVALLRENYPPHQAVGQLALIPLYEQS